MRRRLLLGCVAAALGLAAGVARGGDAPPVTVLVMDPLALPLSCPCVKGHAQRRYDKLGEFLQQQLRRPVNVLFSAELSKMLGRPAAKNLQVIIGKRSVVEFDAKTNDLAVQPAMMLTDRDGRTTLSGWIVVRKDDSAGRLKDLAKHTILFGPPDCAEKFDAAAEALGEAGIALPKTLQTRPGCSDSVSEMLAHDKPPTAAVISSYAASLLEGCGTIPRGSIRVIGKTREVPFVTVFFTGAADGPLRKEICKALAGIKDHKELLAALETRDGFVPLDAKPAGDCLSPSRATAAVPAVDPAWPGWRGPHRDGLVPRLPERLPGKVRILWQREMTGRGLAGIAATSRQVIVADRNAADDADVFHCLSARTGRELWKLQYPTSGQCADYGNTPRATPLVDNANVYTLGALGDLHCVRLADGKVLWSRNLAKDFDAAVPKWGYAATPLVVDGKLIVNPGGKAASLVALAPATGRQRWRSPGLGAAYASFIAGTFGGVRQIVGYDEKSLGGWDPVTGRRLWSLVPPVTGDFNVPTPVDAGGKLLVTTENNGTRLYHFAADGTIVPKPAAVNAELAPDSSTPVLVGGSLFGCWNSLYCLKADGLLRPLWTGEDAAFGQYASLIASPERILVTTKRGELVLVDAKAERFRIVSRLPVFDGEAEVLSHPALVGARLYLRDMAKIVCVSLGD